MDDELLSRNEVAQLLHVSRPYVDKLIDQGDLPFFLDIRNGQRRVPIAAAETYKKTMAEHERGGLERMAEASKEPGLYDDELENARARLRKVGAGENASEVENEKD